MGGSDERRFRAVANQAQAAPVNPATDRRAPAPRRQSWQNRGAIYGAARRLGKSAPNPVVRFLRLRRAGRTAFRRRTGLPAPGPPKSPPSSGNWRNATAVTTPDGTRMMDCADRKSGQRRTRPAWSAPPRPLRNAGDSGGEDRRGGACASGEFRDGPSILANHYGPPRRSAGLKAIKRTNQRALRIII